MLLDILSKLKVIVFSKIRSNRKIIFISIIFGLIFNLFLNFNFILSLFNDTEPIVYARNDIVVGNGIYEIKDINKEINMILIDFSDNPDSLEIEYTSDNFKNYEHINENYLNDEIIEYEILLSTSISGNVNNLRFTVDEGVIYRITLNPDIKYEFKFWETFIFIVIINFICYLFKRNDKLNLRDKKQLVMLILVLISLSLVVVAYYFIDNKQYEFGDFYELYYVDSVMDGKLYVDYPTDYFLMDSENPYDTSVRQFFYIFDASYYQGKYYCYFGIWPVISLFIPYKAITGNYLTTPIACLIYSILGIFATFFIYNSIIKKYFKNISFQSYLLSFIFIIFGSKILWCMHRPNFYEIVSLAAYAHTLFGLYFVLFSDKKYKNHIGYWLLALAVLCRPTWLLCSVLILPKIINNIKEKKFKLIDLILLIIPYLIVGLATMYINYVRFGSIFEFGISYQLSTNNLNNYSFSLFNCIFAFGNYLFGDIDIILFPFKIIGSIPNIPFVTDIHVENFGGGIFTSSILGFIIFFIPVIFKRIKEKELKIYIILALILTFVIVLLSSGIGALIGRYMLDFNYIFYFITIILALYVLKLKHNNVTIKNIYYVILLISIFINFMLSLTNVG